MIRILALLLTALCVTHPAFAKFEVIARATIPEAFLKEFAKAKIHHGSDDILNVEIQELSPDERSAVSASLSEYKAIKPTISSSFPPFYPYRLRSQGVSGLVEALLVVSSEGSVREIYIRSYTDIEFAKAAALALKMWRFKRATHDYVVQVPIPFKIRNDGPANQRLQGTPAKAPSSSTEPEGRRP
jgi:outer membrane biosynthesis protein TonB